MEVGGDGWVDAKCVFVCVGFSPLLYITEVGGWVVMMLFSFCAFSKKCIFQNKKFIDHSFCAFKMRRIHLCFLGRGVLCHEKRRVHNCRWIKLTIGSRHKKHIPLGVSNERRGFNLSSQGLRPFFFWFLLRNKRFPRIFFFVLCSNVR